TLHVRHRIAIRAGLVDLREGGLRSLERGLARLEDVPMSHPQCPRALNQTLVELDGRGELRDLPALGCVDENAGMLRVFRVQAIEFVCAQRRPGQVAATFGKG